MGKPEGIIEDYLKRKAKEHGFLCHKFVSPGTRGVPDRILIGYGRVVFVELKSPDGNLRKQQEIRIREFREHGAHVEVLHTKPKIDAFFTDIMEEIHRPGTVKMTRKPRNLPG